MQNFRALGAPPPDPQNSPPLRISGYAPVSAGFHLKSGKKSVPFWGRLFFGLYLIYLSEKNRGRGSSPAMLKIGQNWGQIANHPPNAQQRSAPLYVVISFLQYL